MSAIATDVLSIASGLGINLLGGLSAIYAVVDATTGQPIVVPDTMSTMGYRNGADISDYPIEEGQFNSYNKVKVPFEIRTVMCCGGLNYFEQIEQTVDQAINSVLGSNLGQGMQRSAFLDALDNMVNSLDLYNIVTPDKTYENVNCVRVSYDRSQRSGSGMIKAEVVFRQIRQSTQAIYSNGGTPNVWSDNADAQNPVGLGTTTTITPSAVQLAQINAGGFV